MEWIHSIEDAQNEENSDQSRKYKHHCRTVVIFRQPETTHEMHEDEGEIVNFSYQLMNMYALILIVLAF